MAEAIATNQDLFMCPICLDVLKDPVTLNCGHNYCSDCIKGCWNREDEKGVYSCPQCRQTFSPRPLLNKNNVLAELVEQFRKTRVQAAPAHCYAGPGELECNVCTGRKLKATKSCLDCLLSYCETHFKAHNDLNPGRQHKVVDATGQLQERICTQHEKPLEIFCRTDQSCVCFLCMVDEHKGHDTVSASAGRREKQTHLGEIQKKFQQRIQEGEKELQELRNAVKTLKSSAQTAVEDSERMFTEMIRSIERRRSEVTELIRAQEKAEVSRTEGLLKQLEQEIAELKRREAELEQLSHTQDHIHFLKTFQSVSVSSKPEDITSIHVSKRLSFEAVTKSVSTLKGQLEDICKQEVIKISASVTEVQAVFTEPTTHKFLELTEVQAVFTEPTTRQEFLKYSCQLTLDPNTAHRNVYLSEGNRRLDCRHEEQPYPDHPDRFNQRFQVLCREGLSGRVYWEVEWSGKAAYIAVSYKSISRKGSDNDCVFGGNNHSWALHTSGSSFKHNNKETKLPLVASSRIGVYVDHSAGILAFYNISDTVTLLHKVQTTFTQTLHPGFRTGHYGSSVKLF